MNNADNSPLVIAKSVLYKNDSQIEIAKLEKIDAKLTKARTQLILDNPFLGSLVLRLPLVAADSWCKTSATDAKKIYYNPKFIASLSNKQTKFVLAHEALHCALTHFARQGRRIKYKWDLACDFAINPLLIKEGFDPPIGVRIFRRYEGMIAEEIYPMIDDNINQEPMDQHIYSAQINDQPKSTSTNTHNKQGQAAKKQKKRIKEKPPNTTGLAQQPKPLSLTELDLLTKKWQKNLACSAQLTKKQAGKLSKGFAALIDFFLQPQVPWQSLLAKYMSTFARDDFSYSRPSRRQGRAILPSLKSHHINITVAIDTSGSISQNEIDLFILEINTIKSMLSAKISLIACDNKINNNTPWEFEAWENLIFPSVLGGGGGTDFNPVFDYMNTQDTPCDVVIYFTDGRGKFPKSEPNYPVLWLVKGKHSVPWGSRIQLN